MPKAIGYQKFRRSPEKLPGEIGRPSQPVPPPVIRPKRRKTPRTLPRSASGERGEGWADALLARRRRRRRGDSVEEMKVVVSVAVEGSPGPVRAMVRLAASVEEAVAAVIERYGREGRSPRLQLHAAASFELHHSHFSLHSLNKRDEIGDVGGRSFYLRTNIRRHSFSPGREASHARISTKGNEISGTADRQNLAVASPHAFSAIAQKLDKFVRRTKRICRMMASILCL